MRQTSLFAESPATGLARNADGESSLGISQIHFTLSGAHIPDTMVSLAGKKLGVRIPIYSPGLAAEAVPLSSWL
jgi:hypothetical protein